MATSGQRGAARLWPVLDRHRRMGEGNATGVPWGAGLGKGGLASWGGARHAGAGAGEVRNAGGHGRHPPATQPRPRYAEQVEALAEVAGLS